MGERGHNTVQAILMAFLIHRSKEFQIRVQHELRLQTGTSRFRVTDACIADARPLLYVEVLSPEDTFSRIMTKLQDYLDSGIPCIWTIDPTIKQAWIHTRSASGDCLSHAVNDGVLSTPDSRLTIPLAELFAE
jgi:Uma2 family endonuclease